jgi:hypothetical protein
MEKVGRKAQIHDAKLGKKMSAERKFKAQSANLKCRV